MVRKEKNQFDWSLTWSPEEDITTWHPFLAAWMHSTKITRCYAILERHTSEDKWHLHIGFTYYRSYKSDYKWWAAECEKAGLKSPALEIHAHDNIFGLVGGYCHKSKEGDRKLLFKKGFSDDQLEYGLNQYIAGLRRQRVRRILDKHLVIHPDKFELAVGAIIAETGCKREGAIDALARDGWCFGRSHKGMVDLYAEVCELQIAIEGQSVETTV